MEKHLECAVFLGGPPALLLAAASKVPYGVEEYGVAGALNGDAIAVVSAETFDCMVPAEAEIVMEGIIRTDILEPEASGYLGPRKMEKVFEVKQSLIAPIQYIKASSVNSHPVKAR